MTDNRNCVNNTTTGSYPLLGPIDVNTPFYLTYSKDGILYTLTYIAGSSSTDLGKLVFDPRPNNFQPITGTASGTGYIFSISSSLDIGTTNCLFTPKSTGSVIIPSSSDVGDWAMLLTGVNYTMTIPSKNSSCNAPQWLTFEATSESTTQPGFAAGIKSSTPVNINLTNIYAIPQSIYKCGDCDTPEMGAIQPSLLFEACFISGGFATNPTACAASILDSDFYSNLSDCTNGIWYNYCSKGKDCSANCRGACSTNGLSCFYDGSVPGFKCEEQAPQEKPFYEQEWFWALIIGLVVLILVLFIIIFAHLDRL